LIVPWKYTGIFFKLIRTHLRSLTANGLAGIALESDPAFSLYQTWG
jgi:hypothetical protein